MSKTNGKSNGKSKAPTALGGDGVPRDAKGRVLPGSVLNPKGSQRGYHAVARASLQALLDQPISGDEKRTKLDVFWEATLSHAVKGNAGAMRIIAERIDPATLQADISVSGLSATRVLDVFGVMAEDYVAKGRLPDLTDRS